MFPRGRLVALLALVLLRFPGAAEGGRESPETVPLPDLSTLEPAVARQIEAVHRDLRDALGARALGDAEIAESFGFLGQLFHAYELFDAAAACYRNANGLSPRDYRWLHLLAEAERRRGALELSRAYHEAALAVRPGDIVSLVGHGEVCLELNLSDRAERSFREALRLDPGAAAAAAGLGQTALSRRDYAVAVSQFETALGLVPEATRLHYPLAIAYRGLGKTDEARRHLKLAGTVGVRSPDPLVDGLGSLVRGERVHLVRGRLAYANGRDREAAAEFAAAVEANPRSVAGRVDLGTALARLGDADGALEQFRRALDVAPENVTAHFNLGRLLAARGDLAGALRHFETASRLAPLDEEAVLGRADALARLGRYEEARAALEDGHRRMPEQGRLSHALAYFLAACPVLALRDGARALDLASRVFEAAPTVRHGRTVALALAELGRCEEAAAWLRHILDASGAEGTAPAEVRRELERYRASPPCRPPP